jgi:hypothetical protein
MKLAEGSLFDEARSAMEAYVLAQADWFRTPTDDGAVEMERARLAFEEVARRLAIQTACEESIQAAPDAEPAPLAERLRLARLSPALMREMRGGRK